MLTAPKAPPPASAATARTWTILFIPPPEQVDDRLYLPRLTARFVLVKTRQTCKFLRTRNVVTKSAPASDPRPSILGWTVAPRGTLIGVVAGAAAGVAVALAGCGSTGTRSVTPASVSDYGAKVFLNAGCGNCHTLSAAKSGGQVGPNLDLLKPNAAAVASQVRTGGGGMP